MFGIHCRLHTRFGLRGRAAELRGGGTFRIESILQLFVCVFEIGEAGSFGVEFRIQLRFDTRAARRRRVFRVVSLLQLGELLFELGDETLLGGQALLHLGVRTFDLRAGGLIRRDRVLSGSACRRDCAF